MFQGDIWGCLLCLYSFQGYLTTDAGCACEDVEPPHNRSRDWAAVVKYSDGDDCSLKQKVCSLLNQAHAFVDVCVKIK